MRWMMNLMPLFLLVGSLPAFSAQGKPQGPGNTHRIQVFRSGEGEPRVRTAASARTASPRASDSAQDTRRTRPYQPAKPGEGAPKN